MSDEDDVSGGIGNEDTPYKSDLLGEAMRKAFNRRLADPLPPRIQDLIARLREKEAEAGKGGGTPPSGKDS